MGLGASVWGTDIEQARAVASRIEAGTVWINCYNVFDPHLPFGGYKESGFGREGGMHGLHAYVRLEDR